MAVLGNYVEFKQGIAKRLAVNGFKVLPVDIVDPKTREAKTINKLVLNVISEDGVLVAKQWSVTSEKLAQQLMPILQRNIGRPVYLTVTMTGQGYRREYSVSVK